jgi:glycosyltransferase involved in cell wall biosynthesis
VTLYTQAKAFLFPQEEDFWLVPIEAMMCGTPVIAYGKWWAKETVIDEVTGVFFDEQTPEKLEDALDRFEQKSMNPEALRNHGLEFSKKKFQNSISSFIG